MHSPIPVYFFSFSRLSLTPVFFVVSIKYVYFWYVTNTIFLQTNVTKFCFMFSSRSFIFYNLDLCLINLVFVCLRERAKGQRHQADRRQTSTHTHTGGYKIHFDMHVYNVSNFLSQHLGIQVFKYH